MYMDIFEYLPQLIVAYDGNDEFANLIHVKKADKDKDYYCPCCGGNVKPRALVSDKEQSHYYHKTGKCTKESQLHFFCKNWLFETGSKFYINNELFEVASIDIEHTHATPFGNYKPDITVYTTSGKTIFFEMFFFNRKTGDDYFCKWNALGNDVVEINIKEYMFKTDESAIPTFEYLYHDGICYSKSYEKKDLYATTIARIKRELTRQKVLNYKARIEQLDWFWKEIRNNESKESILDIVKQMDYEDMLSCYSIIKRKQCVSYLKYDVLEIINNKVISDIRESLNLLHDKNIYFDLEHVIGRTYKMGIRLAIKTDHITYNTLLSSHNYWGDFSKLKGYPKIVFSKNILNAEELQVTKGEVKDLQRLYNFAVKRRDEIIQYEKSLLEFEGNKYKVRVNNNLHTILYKTDSDDYKILLDNHFISEFNIKTLMEEINKALLAIENQKFMTAILKSDQYNLFVLKLKQYSDFTVRADLCNGADYNSSGITFKLFISDKCVYQEELKRDFDDFHKKVKDCELIIKNYISSYSILLNLVNRINNSKNDFWKALLSTDYYGNPSIEIDQKYFDSKKYLTLEKVSFREIHLLNECKIIAILETGMRKVLDNMERCGYRIMEVID